MLEFYLKLALSSLRRNAALTALTVGLVSVGIAASMSTFAILRAMSADPIPQKSAQIFKPEFDLFGPRPGQSPSARLNVGQLPYRDSTALRQAHPELRQTAMYAVRHAVTPPRPRSFEADGRAVYSDFFSMFEAPINSGAPWSRSDDDARANVVVLSFELASRLFPGTEAVGKVVGLRGQRYVVTGVLKRWNPMPRFYDVRQNPFAKTEAFFIPFTTSIDYQIESSDDYGNGCETKSHAERLGGLQKLAVFWTEYWVELPTASAVRNYRDFLYSYAEDQRKSGRFNWPTRVDLPSVRDWQAMMTYSEETLIAPDGDRVSHRLPHQFSRTSASQICGAWHRIQHSPRTWRHASPDSDAKAFQKQHSSASWPVLWALSLPLRHWKTSACPCHRQIRILPLIA